MFGQTAMPVCSFPSPANGEGKESLRAFLLFQFALSTVYPVEQALWSLRIRMEYAAVL